MLDPEFPDQRSQIFEPVSDPLILEMLEHVKQFYFIENRTENIFHSEINKMWFFVRWALQQKIQNLQKKNPLEQRPNKPETTFLINGESLTIEQIESEFRPLENYFETDPEKLEQIKKGQIYQKNKRCKKKIFGDR